MKRLMITYRMTNEYEDAETCIALPVTDAIAEDVLTWGDDSRHIRRGGVIWQAGRRRRRSYGFAARRR